MSPIEIRVNVPDLERYPTGIYSLDKALGFKGDDGMPRGTMVEIAGPWESGKTTIALYLAGMVDPKGRIVIGDLEGSLSQSQAYIRAILEQTGFDGIVDFVEWKNDKGELKSHEAIAKETADALLEDDVSAVILDSVGAFQPLVERKGDIEEAFMGKRAQAMSKYMRRCAAWLRMTNFEKMGFTVNHILTKMASKAKETPGGDAIKFLSRVRMRTRRTYSNEKPNYAKENGFLAKLEITKLTFGGSYGKPEAHVFIVPGLGVSPHMSTVFDCIDLGLAKNTSHGVRIPYVTAGEEKWKSAGKMSTLIKDVTEGKYTRFKRFYEILEAE